MEVYKMTCKNKSIMTKRRAFTLIELLIVIAIIGILFIVLVSKVDFATDKAKATGVQTDFRSFQMAFDAVAKENAGFNTFGWDTGDANQDGIRNSYDEGDNGAGSGIAQNGIQDGTEVFTGHKVYAETFTKVFSLKKNGAGSYDREALNRLETAINANLDPKLHITIKDDGEIVMANGAQDPWNKEYHGYYISNAEVDKKDRGAIVMYSDGANNEFGSEHTIANGVVSISIPGNNKNGKDDYGMAVVYSYTNGFGEIKTTTSGFSNNLTVTPGNGVGNNAGNGNGGGNVDDDVQTPENETFLAGATFNDGVTLTWDELMSTTNAEKYGYDVNSLSATSIGQEAFYECETIVSINVTDTVTYIGTDAFCYAVSLQSVKFGNQSQIDTIDGFAFYGCENLNNVVLPITTPLFYI
jgi:prepilin-type N-terminal cleavage/methylation domain-containing protein